MGSSGGWLNWRLRSGGDIPTGADQTRVYTEGQRQAQAAGHLGLRDRVCMTAAMLVLEPIFEADPSARHSAGLLELEFAIWETFILDFSMHACRLCRPQLCTRKYRAVCDRTKGPP